MGDRYTITERLDQGGMAEVFRGVAESIQGFKKSVAIKRILPSLTEDKRFVTMFLDEAKLSMYLQHANCVQVFDIGMADGTYFLVMEYVNGVNLKRLMERMKTRRRRMSIGHAIYIMLETCKGLNYAHNLENPETMEPLNIVHRDISPPNILLSRNGEVKVVDFGLAKASSQVEDTDPGVVKGKFSYLSPEAASGLPVDARADIFSVGVVLWELLTGKRLFVGESDYQTVMMVREARIPSIRAINSDVEPELEDLVRKSLARDPNQRFQTAADFGDALAHYLFSRRMKVTALDIAKVVRDEQKKGGKKAKVATSQQSNSLIDALITEEMQKLTSLLNSPTEKRLAEGSKQLDPSSFIDTSAWASDFGMESQDASPPPLNFGDGPKAASEPDTSFESLHQILEPDGNEAKSGDSTGPNVPLIAGIGVVVLGLIVAAVALL